MPKPRFKAVRQSGEVILMRLGLLIVPRLPRQLNVRLARSCGRLAYYLDRHGRRVGETNLDIAFGESKSGPEKVRILKGAYQSFALTLFDILWFTRDCVARLHAYVHFDDDLWSILSRDEAQLLVTGHLGNWETGGQAGAACGLPIHSVAAPLRNPGVEALFTPSRQLSGQQIIHKSGALRTMLRLLSEQKKIAILLDQNTRPSEGGIFVPFFGLPVPVSSAPAAVAMRSGANLVFCYCLSQPDGSYRLVLLDAIDIDECQGKADKHDKDALTATILQKAEEAATRYPEYWLWMYKRWKYVAPGHTREDYPWYAKALPSSQDVKKHASPKS